MDNDQLIQQWELKVKEVNDTFTCHPSQQRWSADERWERLEMLGRGGYGEVWLQKCTTGPRVGDLRAVKEISKTSRQSLEHTSVNVCHQELSALIKFSHQQYRNYFVSSFGWFQTPKSLFITMQYFPHGDLQSHIAQPLPDGEASSITRQILRGLSFMHESKFAHRDLKPANILVQEKDPNWWVKLSDFGCSKEATTLRTTVGTPPYWAPELCHIFTYADEESCDCIADRTYSFEVDIWAVGVIAFRLTTGALPFGDNPYSKLYRYVRQCAPFPISSLLTGESKLFSEWLMSRSPGDRPTATQALGHSWISSSSHHHLSASGTIDGETSVPGISGTLESKPASGRWTTATAHFPNPKHVQPSGIDTTSGTQIGRLPSEEQRSANYQSADIASITGTKGQSSDLSLCEHSTAGFWRRSLSFINNLRGPTNETFNNFLTLENSSGLHVLRDHNYIIYNGTRNTKDDLTHSMGPQFILPPSEARPIITTRAETAISVTIEAGNSSTETTSYNVYESITHLAFSPDGKWFASTYGEEYGTRLQLWNIDEQGNFRRDQCLRTTCGYSSPIWVSFSSDSSRLVLFLGREGSSSTKEQLLAVTCTLGGRGYFEPIMSHYVCNGKTIVKDMIVKDERRIMIVWAEPKSKKQRLTIWDANSQGGYDIFQEHFDGNSGFSWSPDGEQYVGVPSRRATGQHFFKSEAPGGMLVRYTLPSACQLASTAAFSPDSRWFAAQTLLGTGFLVFEIMPGGSWKLNATLEVPGTVLTIAFSPDSRTLVASCKTNKLLVWELSDLDTFQLRSQYDRDGVSRLAFSPDGQRLALGDNHGIFGVMRL